MLCVCHCSSMFKMCDSQLVYEQQNSKNKIILSGTWKFKFLKHSQKLFKIEFVLDYARRLRTFLKRVCAIKNELKFDTKEKFRKGD